MVWNDENCNEGGWKNGLMEGFGFYKTKDHHYDGKFKENKFSGYGVLTELNDRIAG